MQCPACRRENPPDSNFCRVCGRPMHVARPTEPLTVEEVRAESVYRVVPVPAPRPMVPKPAGGQSPVFAVLVGLLLPGAGQAYNGQPVKGFFLFFASVLVLPYIYSLFNAWSAAKRLRADGLSSGFSGFLWLGMQVWLALNTLALTAVGLTIAGVWK